MDDLEMQNTWRIMLILALIRLLLEFYLVDK